MRIVLALALVACGSKPQQDTTSSSADGTAPPPGAATGAPATSPGATSSTNAPAVTPRKPAYSCFSYASKNTTKTRYACMRTDDCQPYLDQAKSVAGLKEISGCASVESVWCFHIAPSKTDPEGLEVCQPTSDGCKAERASVVKAGTSADTDCTQQR